MIEIRKIINDEKNIFEIQKIETLQKITCSHKEILELETKYIIEYN